MRTNSQNNLPDLRELQINGGGAETLKKAAKTGLALKPMAYALMLVLSGVAMYMPFTNTAAQPVYSSQARQYQFDIPAGSLDRALSQVGRQSGVQITVNGRLTSGRQSQGIKGVYTVGQALSILLQGSGLDAVQNEDGSFSFIQEPVIQNTSDSLPQVEVVARVLQQAEELPSSYAGGQVATGARLGVMGNVNIMDAPFNVTAYTAQTVEDQQSTTLAGVLKNDPSVRFNTSEGQNTDNFVIRGFELESTDVAFNGMYGLLPGAHVPTEFIERVEVFKGPAGMLFGIMPSGGVGGTINVVPKRAGVKPLTRFGANYESDAHFGLTTDIGRRFGQEGRFGVRFNGSYSDGRLGVSGQKKERRLGSIGLDYIADKWKLELDAYVVAQNQDNGSSIHVGFSKLGHVLGAPDAKNNLLRGTYIDQNSQGFVLRGEYQFNDDWSIYGAIGQSRYNYKGYVNGTRVIVINDLGDASAETYHQRGHYERVSAETGVRGKFETGPIGHEVVASISVLDWKSHASNVGKSTSLPYITNLYHPVVPLLAPEPQPTIKTTDNTFSSYSLLDTVSFLDEKVKLTLGARYQKIDSKSWSTWTGKQTSDYNKSTVTPVVGLVVKPLDVSSLSLYGNYIEGLSVGQQVGAGYANEGETLAPFKTKQYEMGVKWDMGKLTNTLSLFQITKPSTIDVYQLGNLPYLRTDGRQRNRGLEWNIFGEITPQVRVLGGIAYTKGKLRRASDASDNGNTVPGVPHWTANLGAEWDLPWISGLTLDGRMTYTSSQYLNSSNDLKIPSWTRFDLGGRYKMTIRGKAVVWRANIENVADRNYWSGRFNEGYATIGGPRTYKLSATIDF